MPGSTNRSAIASRTAIAASPTLTPAAGNKPGTIKPEEFTQLSSLVQSFGPLTIAGKVSKVCKKMSSGYLHEVPTSPVGLAWQGLSTRIDTVLSTATLRAVPNASFAFLSTLVTNYGPEVIVRKIAKIAARSNASEAPALKALFPKPASSQNSARRSA